VNFIDIVRWHFAWYEVPLVVLAAVWRECTRRIA
jgi:hypothetical protein